MALSLFQLPTTISLVAPWANCTPWHYLNIGTNGWMNEGGNEGMNKAKVIRTVQFIHYSVKPSPWFFFFFLWVLKFWNPWDIGISIRCHQDEPFPSGDSGQHGPRSAEPAANPQCSGFAPSLFFPKEVHLGNSRRYQAAIVELRRI